MQALLIANCVFNAFFSFTAITLNIVTIIALRKPLTIPRAVKILLMSLAVSDLGVGFLVQPLYITRLVMMIKENTQTLYFEIILNSFFATSNFLVNASFFGVVALAADRCSFLSQIPGTSDSQACCYCSDLDLDHKCDSDVAVYTDSFKCDRDYSSTCWKRLLPKYSLFLFQDLLSCTSPQQSNSRPASTVSTE